MSDDVKLIITGTVTIVIFAWVATHGPQIAQLSQGLAGSYSTAVKAVLPSTG